MKQGSRRMKTPHTAIVDESQAINCFPVSRWMKNLMGSPFLVKSVFGAVSDV